MKQQTATACHGLTETEVLDRVHESPLLDYLLQCSAFYIFRHFYNNHLDSYFLTYSLVCQGGYSFEVSILFFFYRILYARF